MFLNDDFRKLLNLNAQSYATHVDTKKNSVHKVKDIDLD
jgi:hypothetical protein